MWVRGGVVTVHSVIRRAALGLLTISRPLPFCSSTLKAAVEEGRGILLSPRHRGPTWGEGEVMSSRFRVGRLVLISAVIVWRLTAILLMALITFTVTATALLY